MTPRTHVLPDQFLRQLGLFDPTRFQPKVVVVGAGGIGSNLVMQLGMLGLRDITVWDMDKVERHNLSTTPYTDDHVGKYKVDCLKEIMAHDRIKISTVKKKYKDQSFGDADIVLSAVDSLAVRRDIFKAARVQKIPFLIDGRLGGQQLRVYSVKMSSPAERAQYLASLNVIPAELPCMAQQVVDVGWMTTSMMVRALRLWIVNGIYNFEVIYLQEHAMMHTSPLAHRKKPNVRKVVPRIPVMIEGGKHGDAADGDGPSSRENSKIPSAHP